MRTLLILTKQPTLAVAIGAVIDPARFQLIVKESVHEAEFLLGRGAIDGTILDTELSDARAIRLIGELKGVSASSPILVYTGSQQWELEEDAYVLGVVHVMSKPVRAKLLNTMLNRMFPEHEPKSELPPAGGPSVKLPANHGFGGQKKELEALRRFSGILAYSLDAQSLLNHFLLLLREIIGVNRAIVFLRKPAAILSDNPLAPDDRWLRSACAIGLDQSVLQHFALSLGAGIGGYLHREGRILRPTHPEALASREITKEFQLLGAQVAIPILDRQSLIGVAVFDERLTGEPYGADELALIFHMLEEVGLAIRNSWLHDQLTANHEMVADILSHLDNACIVVGHNLTTLHANAAALRFFLHDRPGKTSLQFSDLPQQIGSLVFTVIKTGVGVPPFKQQFPHEAGRISRLSIVPFRTKAAVSTNSALLLVEDITEQERAVRLETEASNLRLIKSMAEHLAHEIGNALVPLSTHQQLLKEAINDPEFQESLSGAMASGVKRISRLANQMVFLAREWKEGFGDSVMLSDLIVEAFHEAHTYYPGKKIAQLAFNKSVAPWRITGDQKALRHAFTEIILNALQANPDDPNVAVSIEEAKPGEQPVLNVEVRDSGAGFSAEAAERAQEPFFSTRNVGLGIGLTVSRRIIESHHGSIEIPQSQIGEPGLVRVSLPLQN